jgi:hypothetical protein
MIENKLFVVTYHMGDGPERLPPYRQCLLLFAPDADGAKELAGEVFKHYGDTLRIDAVQQPRYAVVPEQHLDLPDSRPRLEHL